MENSYNRQKKVLKELTSFEEFTPVKVFAQLLSCSDKTIRNDIKYWEKQGVNIEKLTGKGIRLAINQKYPLRELLVKDQSTVELSIMQRRMKILFDLLEGKQLKCSIQSLANKYFVSKTSIVNDLTIIEAEIAPYNLQLYKNVKGTFLHGNEIDIRHALVDIINKLVENKEICFQEDCTRIDDNTLKELEQHFGISNVKAVKNIIDKTEQFLDYKIIDPYYINLVTHILISIERIKNNRTMHPTKLEENFLPFNQHFHLAAKLMSECIEKEFKVILNDSEVFYLYRYLTSSGGIIKADNQLSDLDDLAFIREMAEEIIECSLKIYPLKFSFSSNLYKALLVHLRPMLNRIIYKIHIRNPILEQVKNEFPEIMLLLKLIMIRIQIKYNLPIITDDEIAYLVIYFENAVEEIINKKRVLIVCSSGIGTSHLLKKRIMKYFPEWNIIDTISVKNFEGTIASEQIDLVISTIKLNTKVNVPIAYVNALFSDADANNLRELVLKEFPDKNSTDTCTDKIIKILPEKLKKIKENPIVISANITSSVNILVYQSMKLNDNELCVDISNDKNKSIDIYVNEKKYLSKDTIKTIYYWSLNNK
ncbi:activator of the mannose operon (transcriptional antiterminator) [Pectinatus brassicae]|uniref:Activator of the mannose operon (Transcriptional antiterminator) n=2 Tax=Pectinatus brassicae TaxID=862415 RepID=A0A840UGY4_9FIRM|nr:PRD domain-containing protein [Pectinatus brassicae]MBB5336269.1 activator of the mannose operon (transcriptional antiterminator) [Pectinatus brassicae]